MTRSERELEFIGKYKGLTPAQVKEELRKEISQKFPKSLLSVVFDDVLRKCNSWKLIENALKKLSRYAKGEDQRYFVDEFYAAFVDIRPRSDKIFALKKRSNKGADGAHFEVCPLCWRFVHKRYGKNKKNPYCAWHKSGSSEYNRYRKSLQKKSSKNCHRLEELRQHYLELTTHTMKPHPTNIFLRPLTFLHPEEYFEMQHDISEIWPHLPLTANEVLKHKGDLSDIASVLAILDPIDRVDPLDKFNEDDLEGAEEVRNKRILLHKIIAKDAGLYKRNLCLAEAWLKLRQEVKDTPKGGPRKNSGGRRPGAGRPLKQKG